MSHRVLVVDDEEAIRSLVKDYLEQRGFEVESAGDGEEGIKAFRTVRPHVVLIDFLLPRKNGFAVADAIRKDPETPHVPLIMMSGVFKNPKTAVEAREKYQVLDFLSKPLDLSRIASLVEEATASDASSGAGSSRSDASEYATSMRGTPPVRTTLSSSRTALAAPPTPGSGRAKVRTELVLPTRSQSTPAMGLHQGRPLPQILDEGTIEDHPVAQLLAILRYDELTGMLDLSEQATHRRIYAVRGLPTFMQSNAEGENVGALLLRRGRITEPDFQRCLAAMQQKGRTLQQSLLDLRLANEQDLSTAYKLLAGQLLPLALGMTLGRFKWRETDAFIGRVPEGNFEPVQVIFEGIKRHVHPPQILRFFKGREDVPLERTAEFEKLMPFFRRAFSANNIAHEVEGGVTYREVTRRHSADASTVVPQLYALVTSGMAVLPEVNEDNAMDVAVNAAAAEIADLKQNGFDDGSEPYDNQDPDSARLGPDSRRARANIRRFYDQIHAKNFFEIFSVEKEMNEDKVKGIYFDLAKKWHPDSYSELDLGPTAPQLEAIFERITEAYETITHRTRSEEYRMFLDRQEKGLPTDLGPGLKAEQLYDQGLVLLRRHDWMNAVSTFQQASRLNPGEALYTAQLGWALYNANKRNSPDGEEALETLKQAVQQNDSCALAFQYLGQIAFFRDQSNEAKRWWRRCLDLEPSNIEASRGLRMLSTRDDKDPASRSGLFSKFLKK